MREWLLRLVSHWGAAAFLFKQAYSNLLQEQTTHRVKKIRIKESFSWVYDELLLLFYTLLVWCERKDPNVRFHPLFVCSTSALGGSSALHIPAFPSGGCLIDYAPQVCQLLTSKVNILFIAILFNSAGTLPKFWSLSVYFMPLPIIIIITIYNTNWHLLSL